MRNDSNEFVKRNEYELNTIIVVHTSPPSRDEHVILRGMHHYSLTISRRQIGAIAAATTVSQQAIALYLSTSAYRNSAQPHQVDAKHILYCHHRQPSRFCSRSLEYRMTSH